MYICQPSQDRHVVLINLDLFSLVSVLLFLALDPAKQYSVFALNPTLEKQEDLSSEFLFW